MKKFYIFLTFAALLFAAALPSSHAQYRTLGDGSTTSSTFPIQPSFHNNLTQMVFLASEMGGGPITPNPQRIYSMAFHQAVDDDVQSYQQRHWKVYLSHTYQSGVGNSGVPINSAFLCYDGDFFLSPDNEWTTVTFQFPFDYDGHDDLVVTIIDEGEEGDSLYSGFFAKDYDDGNLYDNLCYNRHSHTYQFTLDDVGWLGWVSSVRPDVRFFSIPASETTQPYLRCGDGLGYDSGLPLAGNISRSVTEQIFTREELGGAGNTIYGVAFYQMPNDYAPVQYRRVKVYMSSYGPDAFLSNTSWADVMNNDLVFRGGYVLRDVNGWSTIWFDEPWTVGSMGSYALVIEDNSDNNQPVSHFFRTHQTEGNTTHYIQGSNYTARNLHNSGVTGSLTNKRNNVRFITMPTDALTCEISGPSVGQADRVWTFTASSNYSSGVTYNWLIQGGVPNILTGETASTLFSTPGTYTVTCTANRSGETAIATKTVTVTDDPEPMTCRIAGSDEGYTDDIILYVAGCNYDDVDCQWSFQGTDMYYTEEISPGNYSPLAFAQWTTPGTYTVTLMTADDFQSAVCTKNVVIRVRPVQLTCEIDGPYGGSIGENLVFQAEANKEGAQFHWEIEGTTPSSINGPTASVSWSEPGTYGVTLFATLGDEEFIAHRDVIILNCATRHLPFREGFEEDISCWSAIDADGDDDNWSLRTSAAIATHSGTKAMTSASWKSGIGALTPDNWLITPRIALPNQSAKITWWEYDDEDEDFADHYGLYISTTGNDDPSSFTKLWEGQPQEGSTWAQREVSLSSYAGRTVYLAFRHFNCTDQYYLVIDDIEVTGTGDYVGIDNAEDLAAKVYPNPTTGMLTVEADGLQSVEVFDALGRMVAETTDSSVDLSAHPAGIYTVRINTAAGTSMKKIMKK